MQAVYRKTSGGLMLRSTSLYGILRGLENRGLIESKLKQEMHPGATRGRTYYEITHLGREVVQAEADVRAKGQ
jgi:DNA-binding PadR family transcriptional regulator